ncbi:MAG TPA: hypothetical protein VF532_05875 [Candidatus Angelobacter sp.]
MRFTIWCKGIVQGTYAGASEAAALDSLAREKGHADFATHCTTTGLTRDDHRVQKVEE